MRVFLDTNVIISAFTARGLCADLFRDLIAKHEILVGEVNIVEARRILSTRFRASAAQVAFVESQLRGQTVVPSPDAPAPLPLRDPDDAWVLASALAAAADMLVTGDKNLLAVAAESPIPILTPRAAWEQLRRG